MGFDQDLYLLLLLHPTKKCNSKKDLIGLRLMIANVPGQLYSIKIKRWELLNKINQSLLTHDTLRGQETERYFQ